MSEAYKIIQQNLDGLNLVSIHIRELVAIKKSPVDLYLIEDGIFRKEINSGEVIDNLLLQTYKENSIFEFFIKGSDKEKVIENYQNLLRLNTRSLSIGDILLNGKNQLKLLTQNLVYLYEDSTNDELLSLQYQGIKSLAYFLISNIEIHPKLFEDFAKQKYHYIYSQPMISSLFLIGALKLSRIISDKEIESLFVTSYFKDIGMCIIPRPKYDLEQLSKRDKIILNSHPSHSVNILSGRIPLSPSYLNLIQNHHSFGILSNEVREISNKNNLGDHNNVVTGFETVLISIMDIIAAMISERPYRRATTLYSALELSRKIIGDNYPHEFKLLVTYFKNFFKNK